MKSLKNFSRVLRRFVTVPGRLRRVVYNAPQASAGYRGCIPWWRQITPSRFPLQLLLQGERTCRELLFLSPSSLPLRAFFFQQPHGNSVLTGLTFPQLISLLSLVSPSLFLFHTHTTSLFLSLSLSCTHTHTHNSSPHMLPPSFSSTLLSACIQRPVLELSYIHPLMFIKQLLID